MKTIFAVATLVLGTALWSTDAGAWASANRFGGRTQHSWGETSHSNAWGGSTTHIAGEGTEHTNMYGGNTAHAYGGGSEHTNMYGGSTYGAVGYGAVHTYPDGASYHAYGYGYGYGAYHPPVAVPYYGSTCYGCAAAAGAVVGLATGAAIASANTAAVANTSYNAGVVAGAAAAQYAMGVSYASLPTGCDMAAVNSTTYYVCANTNTWFKPSYGANGVFYKVVPAP
jgi:hypothetical protein